MRRGGDFQRTLVFAPHIDDEVLGCFAYLTPEAHVVVAGVENRPTVDICTRIAELEASGEALGFTWELLDNPVNSYEHRRLIGPFEASIDRIRPSRVLLPIPSYNQDHRAVHAAAVVATRPHDTLWRVDVVLAYEQPDSVLWPHTAPLDHQFGAPNVFIEIDVEAKLRAYRRYASQVRGHRSPETVAALAALRGAQIGVTHAEAFHALRIIDGTGSSN